MYILFYVRTIDSQYSMSDMSFERQESVLYITGIALKISVFPYVLLKMIKKDFEQSEYQCALHGNV